VPVEGRSRGDGSAAERSNCVSSLARAASSRSSGQGDAGTAPVRPGTSVASSDHTAKEAPMIVQEIMTRDPFVAFAGDTIRAVTAKLAEADVRHLPIVERGILIGMISDRDLREVVPSPLDLVEHPQAAQRTLAQPISSLMSSDVVSVSAGDDVVEAIDLMIEHRIGAVPVIDPSTSELVGIVSYVDALRAAREVLSEA
jgi:acetoin utilization protein AcuB